MRPTTKSELLMVANDQFDKMWKLIDGMSDETRSAAFDFADDSSKKEAHWKRDRNPRDVLIHLYEWHQLLLNWVQANLNGEAKPFLPEPYNWKTYGDMNLGFWEKHQSTPYAESKRMLLESHKKVLECIERFSSEELFEKRRFPWTATSTLGSYCVSCTSSHYEWAMKKIKAHIKASRGA